LVTYGDGLPVYRQSPIQVVTAALVASHYTRQSPVYVADLSSFRHWAWDSCIWGLS